MRKKLLAIFGPIILAGLMVLAVFLFPFHTKNENEKLWSKAASSMSANIIRGNAIKNDAIASGKYVPFFGSSELSRIDAFHPSVLAEKYHRSYTPFLLGAPGTQSLTQYMMIRSMGDELANKKIVFIISPQWFVKDGVNKSYFSAYFSELQTYQWLLSLKKITPEDQYLATRLTSYGTIVHNTLTEKMLLAVADGQLPTTRQNTLARLSYQVLSREDQLFSSVDILSKKQEIHHETKKLPATYDLAAMKQLAIEYGKKNTDNNLFDIDNHFFETRLKKHVKKLKHSQIHFDYRFSPEYSDFQLVLSELAKVHAEPLFIIPPVNKKWSEYTGLSQDMLAGFSTKIRHQLTSQGFTNIADFTNEANVPYFMADTIHLGWLGWLSADKYIEPFLRTNEADATQYQLSNQYLTKEWQLKKPQDISSKQ